LPKIVPLHVPEAGVIGDVTLVKELPSEVRRESQSRVGGEVSPLTSIYNQEFTEWAAAYAGPKFHAVLSDIPYGLHFMNAKWDDPKQMTKSQVVRYLPSGQRMTTVEENIEFQNAVRKWGEAMLPLLYPGALVMMFAAPRMWEWVATGMQLAGFLHWDTIMWIHAQGFPKAQDIGGMITKATGEKPIAEVPNPAFTFQKNSGQTSTGWKGVVPETKKIFANQWQGYKTAALKPAHEPILCFRAPGQGMTCAERALQFGTGALNIDGGRIGTETISTHNAPPSTFAGGEPGRRSDTKSYKEHSGRYPANLILDEPSAEMLDEQSGISVSGIQRQPRGTGGIWSGVSNRPCGPQYGDRGGASRFFYHAKASKKERNAGCEDLPNDHPCVKPIALTRYLATLLLPPDSVSPRRLMVPFAGSGSEMIGAKQAGWDEIVGIEQKPRYCEIAKRRLKALADCCAAVHQMGQNDAA
jgi:hypothetical protein